MGAVSPIPEESKGTGIRSVDVVPNASAVLLASLRRSDWRVLQHGFDTLVFGFKPTTPWAMSALARPVTCKDDLALLTGKPCTTDDTGRPMPVSVTESGNWTARFGYATVLGLPEWGLVRVECRPAALLARDQQTTSLLSADRLAEAETAARRLAASVLGNRPFEVEAPPKVHRADLTVDVVQEGDLTIGKNALFAAAQVRLPYWGKAKAHPAGTHEGYLEGVTWASRSQLQFRAYDKASELRKRKHGSKTFGGYKPHPLSGDAGRWLRFERQFRPTTAEKRLTVAELAATDLRALWLGRWAGWLSESDRDLLVCGRSAAAVEIGRLVEACDITTGRAQSLLGALTAWDEGLMPQLYYGGDQRAANQLRSVGIAYSREMPPLAAFPLGGLLSLAASAWTTSS